MEQFRPHEIPKFNSHEDEIAFLRAELNKKEIALAEKGVEQNREKIAHDTIVEYKKSMPEIPLPKPMTIDKKEQDEIVLRLKPEEHDRTIEELLALMLSKGIHSALQVVAELKNPHIDADFHRFLVQYLCEVHAIPGLKENTPLFKAIDMKLFEITLPEPENDKDNTDFKHLITSMEQFYAGMHSVGDTKNNKEKAHFTLEIVLANNTDHIIFYAAVPSDKATLLEKHVLGVHAKARINEVPDDYSLFHDNNSGVVASYAKLKNHDVFPIKTYENIDHDPLNIMINVFTKLKKSGESAALQLVVCPKDEEYIEHYHGILKQVKDGTSIKDAMRGGFAKIAAGIGDVALSFFKKDSSQEKTKEVDDEALNYIQEKVKK